MSLLYMSIRNPEPESRPSFPEIQVDLQRPDFKLLKWTPEDVTAYSEHWELLWRLERNCTLTFKTLSMCSINFPL